HYTDSDIQVLEGLEAVRKRPGMYIGSTGEKGLHHLVWEIVDNAVDEALAGFCDDIEVIVDKGDIIEVRDDGRGIPTGINEKTGLSTVETIFTVLHAGGKFGGEGYKVSGGLHGVGASVVNALSSWLRVVVCQDGKIHEQEYRRGKPLYDLRVIGETEKTGTRIELIPDVRSDDNPAVVVDFVDFQYEVRKARLRGMAFLNKGIRIVFEHERSGKSRVFHYEGGIIEFVKSLNKNKNPLFPEPIYIEGMREDTSIEV